MDDLCYNVLHNYYYEKQRNQQMIKMDLVSSDDQASSMNTVSANRIAGYQSAISALESFSNASELTGAAYDSAKHYGASVLTPLI